MEQKIKNYITAQLRRIFKWSDQYKQCKQNQFIQNSVYRCQGCECLISKNGASPESHIGTEPVFPEKLYVDHIEPVAPVGGYVDSWDSEVIGRIFPGVEGLQYLCQSCHYIKTQIENDERRLNK